MNCSSYFSNFVRLSKAKMMQRKTKTHAMHLFENDHKRRILSLEINAHKTNMRRSIRGKEKKTKIIVPFDYKTHTHTQRYKYV